MPRRALTLIELLVVISIIGLLSSVAAVSMNTARMNARNQQRKANLTQLYKALELYYSEHDAYPSTGGGWRGACSDFDSYPDTGSGAWIPGFGEYVAKLPRDPNTNKANSGSASATCRDNPGNSCFLYRTNATGTEFKLMAHCVPEGALSASDPFYDPNHPTWAWAVYSSGAAGF